MAQFSFSEKTFREIAATAMNLRKADGKQYNPGALDRICQPFKSNGREPLINELSRRIAAEEDAANALDA